MARLDGFGRRVVGTAEFPLDEDQRHHDKQNDTDHQQKVGTLGNHASLPRTASTSASTFVFARSAFMTTTVRSPSAIARGTCVIAKMPANFRNEPGYPLAASG